MHITIVSLVNHTCITEKILEKCKLGPRRSSYAVMHIKRDSSSVVDLPGCQGLTPIGEATVATPMNLNYTPRQQCVPVAAGS